MVLGGLAPLFVQQLGGASKQTVKQTGELSLELFQFDFANLTIKLFAWFLIAIAIDKIHSMLNLTTINAAATIAGIFGYKIPKASTEPKWFKKLFTTYEKPSAAYPLGRTLPAEGYFGLSYWDFVKIGAIILVFIEFMRYYENQKQLGGKPSPFTIGIFLMIMTLLSAFTVPEIIQKIKARKPNEVFQ